MSILAPTARSAAWVSLALPITTAATFVGSILIARQMLPSELGTYALVAVVVALTAAGATLFGGNYYVISPHPSVPLLRTAVTLELIVGGTAWLLVAFAAAVYAAVGGQPRIGAFLAVEALVLPLNAYGNPYGPLASSFKRDFAYRTPTLTYLAVMLASVATKVVLVTLGLGVWGLIAGDIVLAAGYGIVMLALVPAGRRLAFDRGLARKLRAFGVPSAATSVMGLASERGSELVVAVLVGAHALGIYFVAARIPAQLYQLGGSLSSPVLTAFSRSTHEQLARGFMLVTRFSAFFTLLPLAVVITLAEPLVTTFYGEQWAAAAAPLALLTAAVAVRLTFWHTANLLKSQGRVKEITLLTALQLVLVLTLSSIGAWKEGATGAAAAVLVVELVLVPPKIYLARTVVPFATARALCAPAAALVGGVVLSAAAALVLPDGAALLLGSILVCASFAAIAWTSDRVTLAAIASSFLNREPGAS